MPRKQRAAALSPVATITTSAGAVAILSPVQDTDHSVAWVVQGPRSALTLLLPGLIHETAPTVRCLVQFVVVGQHRPRRR